MNGRRMTRTDRRWTLRLLAAAAAYPLLVAAQAADRPAPVLPAQAAASLSSSVDASRPHARHVWRDAPPFNGTLVNAYIEIARGDRRKWEFDMAANRRRIDRMMPPDVGGYPVNYGFVPQTVSYDGDPFDALVLGPAISGGRLVRGAIVGLMLMEDEKGIDSKVVLSPVDARGRATHRLTDADRDRIAAYFRIYKRHEPGKFSKVPGWGSPEGGRQHVEVTHAFFLQCRATQGAECRVMR